ncbi:MAG: BlaI/MecI/CopY family transcriptional regulator [Chloroflexota bacterium]|nr:BlaI/MecI/CopY family transcriptional regulator [Chloroflexota bacterium]
MSTAIHRASLEAQANAVLKKLLGSLELEVMNFVWQTGETTVQEVTDVINYKRRVAYTTIMTVMVHLVDKGLLTRIKEGKKYRYKVALTRQEFIRESAKSRLQDLIGDFGDIAIAQFLEEAQKIDADRLEWLRKLVQEGGYESNTAEQDI